MTRSRIILFLLCAPLFLRAHPMGISFDEMIRRCSHIYVAEFLGANKFGTTYDLKVGEQLKGKAHEETRVGRAHGAVYFKKGARFLAFINEENQLEWAGTCDSLETELIDIEGFYDYNAYDVWPSGITMVQLKQYLAEGKFNGAMEGDLEFMNYTTLQREKTPTSFRVTYTYSSNDSITYDVVAQGLPLVDFPKRPRLGFWGNGVRLEYEENGVRPLEIDGYVDSVYADGKSCHAHFKVSEPEDMTRESFYEYLGHPEYGPQYYEFEITLNDTAKFSFFYGIESGRTGYLQYYDRRINCMGFGCPTRDGGGEFRFTDYWNPEILITLDTLPRDDERFQNFNGSGSIYCIPGLRIAPWTGEWQQREGGKLVGKGKCTVRLKKEHYSKNVNYGK